MLTASRDCNSRQDLLGALTLAVEAIHPAAVRSLAEYIANPLTDDELSQLVAGLRADTVDDAQWAQQMSRKAQSHLLHRVNLAKTQYATYLRAQNKRDIKMVWPYDNSLHAIGMLHRREIWLFVEAIWQHRYTDHEDQTQGQQSYKGFSVVLGEGEFERVREVTSDWPVYFFENVVQTFGPLETGSNPCSLEDIYVRMAKALADIHENRFNTASEPITRGNDTWFPFPNVIRKSTERVAPSRLENLKGKRLDTFGDWDAGKPRDVVLRGVPRPPSRHIMGRHMQRLPKGKLPPHWSKEEVQRDDFFKGNLGDGGTRGVMCWPELYPDNDPSGRYNKAARRIPPKEYQMQALSVSGDDSGSVAVASLSAVTGDLQRMKSFVRKPCRGDGILPTVAVPETEQKQADPLPTPPSSATSVPPSGRPRNTSTGLETPPDSASPIKAQRMEMVNESSKGRAPSAAAKLKANACRHGRSNSRSQWSRESLRSKSSTTTHSRTTTASSIEPLTKVSTNDSSTALACSDSPSPTNLWSQPSETFRPSWHRKDSGLGTFSPTKQATTSVQHIDVVAQHRAAVVDVLLVQPEQKVGLVVEKHGRDRIDSGLSAPRRCAVQALRNSVSSREIGIAKDGFHGVLHRW